MNLISNQNFDPYKHLDSAEPSLELTGHEERNARINDGTFRVGSAAISATTSYELSGKHSLRSQNDIIYKPLLYSRAGFGRHNAQSES